MSLDVVVPMLRTKTVGQLLHSLALGTSQPDAITLVSNKVPLDVEAFGLPVRAIRFQGIPRSGLGARQAPRRAKFRDIATLIN